MVRPESDLTLEALAERVEELERRLSALGNGSASVEASPVASARVGNSAPQYTAASVQPAVHAPSVSAPASGGSFDQPVSAAQSSQIPAAQVSLGQNAARSQAPVSQPAAQLPPQASAPVVPSVPQASASTVQSTPQASAAAPAAQPAGSFPSVPRRPNRTRQQRLPLRSTCLTLLPCSVCGIQSPLPSGRLILRVVFCL